MATTETHASAQTETRINILVAQINYIVRETTGAQRFKDILEQGMIHNKWISKVTVEALDEKNDKWAEIEVTVDWERHKINIRRDGEMMIVDKDAPEGEKVSWVIGEVVRWF